MIHPSILLLLSALLLLSSCNQESKLPETKDTNNGRAAYLNRKLISPDGSIIRNRRAKELAFAKTLPKAITNHNRSNQQWLLRGPINIGGRTRALAQDISNSEILFAGGISGGLFRSIDKGSNWTRIVSTEGHQGISCIAQDERAGKENIWYYGSGEAIGNSASAYGAHFTGNGIYKSIDNGLTWTNLESTTVETPQNLSKGFDQIYNIACDNTIEDKDIIYCASYGGIQKSIDGGTSWTTSLDATSGFSTPLHSDIEIAENGLKYAFISKELSANTSGIYISEDGDNWNKITPSFAKKYNRMILEADPNDGNVLYVFGETPDQGNIYIDNWHHDTAYCSLWKYDHSTTEWTDLSQNIPNSEHLFDGLNTQTGYNLVIEVSPHNSKHILIGGNNLILSVDGFENENTRHIGGYIELAKRGETYRYPNHHPDNHVLVFDRSNENGLISGHDGGVSYTQNFLAESVEWTSLCNGYYTTQSHAVTINQNGTDDIVITGLQDNGTLYTGTKDITDPWVISLYGDGAYAAISDDSETFYCSSQSGNIFKMTLDDQGNKINKYRIKPRNTSDVLFIDPFILDPNDDNILYYLAGRRLFRSPDLSVFPTNDTNTTTVTYGWDLLSDSIDNSSGYFFTAMAASKGVDRRLYLGTAMQKVYRIDNPHEGDPDLINISNGLPSGGYVTSIAIDPSDPDKIAIIYSNYNIKSIFYSEDGGESYISVAGNLEERKSGSGNGPSCRSMQILNGKEGNKIYLVGTSTGLYTSNHLIEDSTIWYHVASDEIGYSVIEMLTSRNTDNLVVLGTHGNSVYSSNIDYYHQVNNINEDIIASIQTNIYPNPSNGLFNIESKSSISFITVYDELGRIILTKKIKKSHTQIDLTKYPKGKYYLTSSNSGNQATTIIYKI